MTPEQFRQLLHYIDTNFPELSLQYPDNFVLGEGGLGVVQPAVVSDETHKELMNIIEKWKKENNIE